MSDSKDMRAVGPLCDICGAWAQLTQIVGNDFIHLCEEHKL